MRALLIVLLALLAVAVPAAAAGGTTISGRILDTQGGLTVPNATVELGERNAGRDRPHRCRRQLSDPDRPPGTYAVYVRAAGYQTTRILPDLLVTAEIPEVAFQTAIARQPQGLKQIGYVVTAGRTALQTTTTINTHIDTSVIQSENYQRLADVLTTVPGVITSTSSSVGDDMSLSIRGYDPTETATLLDGHPIGPVGAFGGGYNYNVSPFWGLSGADVIFGSGATGLFGATTIAGAVNFQTINPTQQNHVSVTEGVGSNNKAMTGLLEPDRSANSGMRSLGAAKARRETFPAASSNRGHCCKLASSIRASSRPAAARLDQSQRVQRSELLSGQRRIRPAQLRRQARIRFLSENDAAVHDLFG